MKRKKKVKKHKIQIPIYGDRIIVYIADSIMPAVEKAEEEYECDLGINETYEAVHILLTNKKTNEKENIILLPTKVSSSILAHEAIHAAYSILDYAHVKVDSDNHEALTYLVGYIMEEISKVI
jgi:hypothetical protein